MFVKKDFVRDCFVAQLRYAPKFAYAPEFAHICATKRRRAKFLATNIGVIARNIPTNFKPERLKPKLDIVEKPENRVHKLTNSNVSRVAQLRDEEMSNKIRSHKPWKYCNKYVEYVCRCLQFWLSTSY